MSAAKKIFMSSLALFAFIGAIAVVKKKLLAKKDKISSEMVGEAAPSIELEDSTMFVQEETERSEHMAKLFTPVYDPIADKEVDQVWRLFTTGKSKLPIVETIYYKSRVPWLKGRPAWIADYASHYATSRHFIARSLNRKRDYDTQKISSGNQFNILSPDKNLKFYLIVDLSRCKMWFYYYDIDANERVLLKIYRLGLGRFDPNSDSGLLTPKGHFLLGDKVASYKLGKRDFFQGVDNVEMIQVVGTRWIPFSEQVNEKGDQTQGYGLHGAPWIYNEETDSYTENLDTIGKYESDGCIRLSQEDIEELYSIVITKPTVIEIVADYQEASLPGIEVER